MQCVDRSDLEDAERGHCIGGMQFRGKIRDAVDFLRLTDSDTPCGNVKRLCNKLRNHRRECPAAYEHDGLRRFAVEFENLLCNRVREIFNAGLDRGDDLFGGERELHAENIGEGDVLTVGRFAPDILSDVEIEQIFTRDHLGDLVTRHRHGAVGDDGAAACNGNIGCARADIHEDEIQMAHRRRDEDVDAGDRFERESLHLQMGFAQSRLHGVNDLPREECGNDGRLCFASALSDERLEIVAVEGIADRAVSDTVIARRIVDGVGMGKPALCFLHACEVEVALLCGCDNACDILLGLCRHRIERTPGSGHGDTVQRARAFGQTALDLADDSGNLRHIVNLPVQHRARLVLHALGSEDMEHAVPLFGDDADDAACPNVKRKDEFGRAIVPLCLLRLRRCVLFRAAAFFCRDFRRRCLLHAFSRAAAALCRHILRGYIFACFIQIRHLVLPCKQCILLYLFVSF